MDSDSKAGAFIFLGIFAILGIVLLTRHKSSSYSAKPVGNKWELVRASASVAPVMYENEERWEIVRGSDRLIEEIVIHRKVTQND